MEQAERMQRHNFFRILFMIKDCHAQVIIDGGSCNNLVSSESVKKLGLTTRPHKHLYHVQWLNGQGNSDIPGTFFPWPIF
jgi:hypothetical protein